MVVTACSYTSGLETTKPFIHMWRLMDLVTTCKWACDPTCNWGSPGKLTKTSTHSTGRGSVLSKWGRKGVHAWVNGLKTRQRILTICPAPLSRDRCIHHKCPVAKGSSGLVAMPEEPLEPASTVVQLLWRPLLPAERS